MARLLAMALNCQSASAPVAEPCGECSSCTLITSGNSPDVIELDAASNRGIDEIRALQENVGLAPMSGRYKVYIIDEAHQMTKDAYNAFLKTLEEPPPHVVFVLATTEPEKILPTVRSRCQRFDFRPVPEPDILQRLRNVAAAENIEAPDELLTLIARKAEGSLRDALGLLEQCVSFAGDKPTAADFLMVTGGVDRDSLRGLAAQVIDGEAAGVVVSLDDLLRTGRDPGAIVAGLMGYLRDLFLASLRSDGQAAPEGGRDVLEDPSPGAPLDADLAADAGRWPRPVLVACMDALVRADSQMRYSSQPRLVLEMALLSLALGPREEKTRPGLRSERGQPGDERVTSLPAARPPKGGPGPVAGSGGDAPRGGSGASQATGQAAGQPAGQPADRHVSRSGGHPMLMPAPGPDGVRLQWLRDNWGDLLDRVRKKSVFARAFLLKATPIGLDDGVVTLGFEARFHKEQMEEEKNRRACEDALSEAAGTSLKVRCRLLENGGVGPAAVTTSHADGGPVARDGPAGSYGDRAASAGGSAHVDDEPDEEALVPRESPARLPPPENGSRPGSRNGRAPSPGGPRGDQYRSRSRPGQVAHGSRLPGDGGSRSRGDGGPRSSGNGDPRPAGTGYRPARPGPGPVTEGVRTAIDIFNGQLVDDTEPGEDT